MFDGREIFRFDTFGDEQLWTDVLHLHEAVQTVSPATALSVGLKVDVDALPQAIVDELVAKDVDLNDPAVTIALLKLDAVVGVKGNVDESGHLTSIGITCALCHSNVDDSFTKGIGKRLDGWANHDLNVGVIAGLAPGLAAFKTEFSTWGPGKYDPRHHAFDGVNLFELHPGMKSVPVVTPAIYGLKGVGFETYTADGPISYWNSYVGVSQMGGTAVQRSAKRPFHQPDTGSGHTEAQGLARLSTQSSGAQTAGGQLRSQSRCARAVGLLSGGRMWLMPLRAELHRRAERPPW